MHVVTTNPLAFIFWNRSIAACICDVAFVAKMANGTPIGLWWRAIVPIEVPGNASVAWLGVMDEQGRLGVKRCAEKRPGYQTDLFHPTEPEWMEVDVKRVRVERSRKFGGRWLGKELLRRLALDEFLEQTLPNGREEIPWSATAMILLLARLCEPSSELHLAEHVYQASALSDLLGIPDEKVNEDRLYRALDTLLPHKKALEKHLKEKLGELFDLDYDLLLYDITSTYFKGQADGNPRSQRGYSRDHRPDCKQVNIALVVSRCGMPLGYEVFAGNRHDATTLEERVGHVQQLYGRAGRVWIIDRGLMSEKNVQFLRAGARRYILGTAKSSLRKFERELLSQDWKQVHEGLEVRLVPSPAGEEVFILCRSAERQAKERAMHERFEKRIEDGLAKIAASCGKRRQKSGAVERRVGRFWSATHGRPGCSTCRSWSMPRASRNSAGPRWRAGGSGRAGARGATCCAAM